MKKSFKRKTLLLVLSLLFVMGFSACTGQPSDDNSDSRAVTISISIIYPKEAKKEDAVDVPMNVSEEANIQQVLEAYCERENITIESDNGFITTINGLKNEGSSGWTYTVNGKQIQKLASKVKVKADDKIVWEYSSM